ncbi:uncharacterized protein si:ch211-125o16.4 isoform X3 [Gadus morhua]|uniref:uncharacterized protein si:ch211-125o16.4 isoform X3 n=1 Tax=Gadus morhua TaxID=8049 RepID=UPI0011B6C75E|nr:uncharacterized protein LOC115560206 isoform X3 [Gadus morhua]
MSEDGKSFSDSLQLEDSERGGVVIKGLADTSISASSGLKEGDEIVGATVHLDHLSKQDVLKILKVLEPYDENMTVLTKSDLSAGIDPGSLSGPGKMLTTSYKQKKMPSLEAQGEAPALNLTGLNTKLNSAIGLDGDINGELPNLNLNKPSADGSGTFRIADTGLPGLDLNGAGFGNSISAPSAELSSPNATLGLKKTGVKGGNFTAPNLRCQTLICPTSVAREQQEGLILGR